MERDVDGDNAGGDEYDLLRAAPVDGSSQMSHASGRSRTGKFAANTYTDLRGGHGRDADRRHLADRGLRTNGTALRGAFLLAITS
jgi:hypothetical protein